MRILVDLSTEPDDSFQFVLVQILHAVVAPTPEPKIAMCYPTNPFHVPINHHDGGACFFHVTESLLVSLLIFLLQ
jgi:hypothetical protein